MISKSLSTSEKFASLTDIAGDLAEFCQVLYPLLVSHADDFGRLQGDAFTVKHMCFPISPRSKDQFAQGLSYLQDVTLIQWYQVDDKQYVQVLNFEAHQQGLHKRTESVFPEYPGTSGKFTVARARGTELKGTEGKGTKANGTDISLSLFVPKRENCEYCGATSAQTGFALELDHFVPRRAGGSDDASNRVWSCHPCNQAKSSRVFESIDICRQWLHHAFWHSNRKRWITHRSIAFSGIPPIGFVSEIKTRQSGTKTAPDFEIWECPHVDECPNRGACRNADLLDRPRKSAAS